MDDEPFPGIVEVRFIDATGRCWSLIDKCATFAAHLGAEAQLTVPDAAWSVRQLSVVRLAFLLLLAGLVGPGAERSGQAGLVGADWRAPPLSQCGPGITWGSLKDCRTSRCRPALTLRD
ncbi:hypothetical protein ACIGZJ_31850 [Kitasatospora sp. NPDC052868]|uniref:hypothetical protein n=1 Tax=Kitasatospora sp. NPDC052868 TaxID=3364060 RepID=UPI0037CB34AC